MRVPFIDGVVAASLLANGVRAHADHSGASDAERLEDLENKWGFDVSSFSYSHG